MRLQLNLTNPLVYTPVASSKPTQKEISQHLYANRPYITNCTTLKEKKKFVGQWKWLVDNFSKMLSFEIGHNLNRIRTDDAYQNLAMRLKKGIAESVLDSGDGLLPRQNSTTFCDLKLFLEAICIYAMKNPGEKRMQTLLKDLLSKLTLCGPGLFTHIQEAYFELHQPADGLFYWLANFREIILKHLTALYCQQYEIADAYQVHAYNAFSMVAKKNEWHLLQENQNIDDTLINTAIPKEWEDILYAEFEKKFEEKYGREAVAHLSERLTAFIVSQFNQYALNGVLSSENHDAFQAFFSSIMPVLDSFKLSPNYFLKVAHEIDPTEYTLNQKALDRIDVYVAFGLYESGMLESNALALLCVISNACLRGNDTRLLGEKIISDTSPQTWLTLLKEAFNANPPETYRTTYERDLRRKARSVTLFGAVSPFHYFLDELKASNWQIISIQAKLALIINSPTFYEFMTNQLELKTLFVDLFREKYPTQQVTLPEEISSSPKRRRI